MQPLKNDRNKLGFCSAIIETGLIGFVVLGLLWSSSISFSYAAPANSKKVKEVDSDVSSLQELELEMDNEVKRDVKSSKNTSDDTDLENELDQASAIQNGRSKKVDSASGVSAASPTVASRKVTSNELTSESPRNETLPNQGQSELDLGPAPKNEIFNLEFKVEGDVSRIFINSRSRLRYKEQKNPTLKQYVYYFENTTVPERIERAYDTSEFVSPVALFTILQVTKNKVPSVKLIIQLREDKTPEIKLSERGMSIDFPAPSDRGEPNLVLGDSSGKIVSEESTSLSPNWSFTGKPIERLEIKNMDIQDAIRLVGRSSGYNIVISDDVDGKIGSLSLEGIPWDQAFALLLQSKQLGYVKTGNVIRVSTLKSLQAEKDEIAAVENSKIKAEPLRTILIPISYAKAADLVKQGKVLKTERGTLEVDERSNTIIVREVESVIGKIQKLFAMLDNQPPVVSISAKVVEVDSNFQRQYGFSFGKISQSFSGINASAETNFANFSPGDNAVITLQSSDFVKINSSLSLGELDGTTKVLANPTVSVNQNTRAVMTQTIQDYYQQMTVVGGIPTITYAAQDAVLSLEVTPVVAGDGAISMTVNVNNDIMKEARAKEAPRAIDKRNVQTQVLLENGDTAVIGGAFQSNRTSVKNGIPGLMKLPLIGLLFSDFRESEIKSEILIFLTAKILNIEESFKRTF